MRQNYTVKFRRKLSGKTNYHIRLKLLSSGLPRLVIRKSLHNLVVQIVLFEENGDKVVSSAHTRELIKLGWKASRDNLPAAYLCGLLAGKKALAKNISKCIADIGMQASTSGSRIYAALKGALDAGLSIPVAPDILPSYERVSGRDIESWALKLKQQSVERYKRVFSQYLRNGLEPERISEHFEQLKAKIIQNVELKQVGKETNIATGG
ncbi:MAG: 50S ribosomal protein L18 [Candidatus Woesearchaeota archaeon]